VLEQALFGGINIYDRRLFIIFRASRTSKASLLITEIDPLMRGHSMPQEKITITRTELYEKVWTTPMRKLAPEYGLSDVGLAKLCRRHNIPRPGLGYWACVSAGQRLKRTALPPSTDPRLDTIEILRHESERVANVAPGNEIPVPIIEVSADREITHRVVKRIEKSLRSKTDEQGFLLARMNRIVPLKVSADPLLRALRIVDVLFSSFEERGLLVEWPPPYSARLAIVSDNEKLHLDLTEVIERKKHQTTREEEAHKKRDYWWNPRRWDYCPTGHLRLTLESVEFPEIHGSWSDGKRQRLEAHLGEIVVKCERAGAAVKVARQARIDAERRRIREQKLEYVVSQQRADYERKREVIKRLSETWTEINQMRDFATALQAKMLEPNLSNDTREELEAMIDWTVRYVHRSNPLSHLERSVQEFKRSQGY
jgi:hypothetical protein